MIAEFCGEWQRAAVNVQIVNTGTELLLGDVINTHLSFIARAIFQLGLRVGRQITVPDGNAIASALEDCFAEAEIVFVTGGLGPTSDDLTRDIAAKILSVGLQNDPEVTAAITSRLTLRKIEVTDRILRQAQVPTGAIVLPNANGTAPGLYVPANVNSVRRSPHLFLLPGPPRELQPMFEATVFPILRDIVPADVAMTLRTFRLAGVGESVIEEEVGEQILALDGIELGYCARPAEVDVRLIGPAASVDRASAIIQKAFADSIFTTTDETLETVVVRLLAEKGKSVATAESCTGGFLAHRITNVPGASKVFSAGYITYSNETKTDLLGVDHELLKTHGAVSEAVARMMAENARDRGHAIYGLATTGIAGPTGGTSEKSVGTVYIAVAERGSATVVKQCYYPGDRETFKRLVSQTALEMLRQILVAR